MTDPRYEGPVTPIVVARPVPATGAQRTRTYLSIIALVLGIILMLGALYTSVQTMRLLTEVSNRLAPATAPADTPGDTGPTGCPFGEGQCGG